MPGFLNPYPDPSIEALYSLALRRLHDTSTSLDHAVVAFQSDSSEEKLRLYTNAIRLHKEASITIYHLEKLMHAFLPYVKEPSHD